MKKALFFAVLLSLVASSAMAMDTAKRFGLGFVNSNEAIGGRYWISPKIGLDFGVGFLSQDVGDSSETDFQIGFGLPINIMNAGDRVNFHFNPHVSYWSINSNNYGAGLESIIAASVALEFEFFVSNDFSVSASHGVQALIKSPEGDGDSLTDFKSFGENVTDFGFHYYFPGK